MKNIKFVIFFCVISTIAPWIFGDSCHHDVIPETLIKRDSFLCMKIGCLERVTGVTAASKKDPNCEYWITLNAEYFRRIRGNAFDNVPIDGLEIKHGDYILFDKDSLNGLPNLRYLKIRTKTYIVSSDTDFDPTVFHAVSNIIHLDYPFYSNNQMVKVLPIFTKLEKLTVLESPPDLDYRTFSNASSSLKKIEFIAPTGMNIYLNAFLPLPGLTELEFTNSAVNFMEPGVFNGLDKLKNLTIWFKSPFTAMIPKNVLNSLKRLETLTIKKGKPFDSDRKISIEVGAFQGLTVRTLDMKQVFVDVFVKEIFNGLIVDNLHIQVNNVAAIKYQAFVGSRIMNLYFWNIKEGSVNRILMSLWGLSASTSVHLKNDTEALSTHQ